jgi:hypothetical protein
LVIWLRRATASMSSDFVIETSLRAVWVERA